MITHHSTRIQNAIQRELFRANKSIKLAVAWFTNDLLFQPLLLKLAQGVEVEIILNEDEINKGADTSLDFSDFIESGGVLRWNNTGQLMHDKFCIIDDDIVIFGSYNWTNKAEYNEESISIATSEESTTEFYLNKFNILSAKYPKEISTQTVKKERTDNNSAYIVTPLHFSPNQNLQFYDEIYMRTSLSGKIKYFIAQVGELYQTAKFCLLDQETFLPDTNFLFEEYKSIIREDTGIIWLKVDGYWGLYNALQKKFILHPQYESINNGKYESNTIYAVKKYGYMGVVDINGKTILPFIYSNIYIHTETFIEIERNKKHGLWSGGTIIFDCIYDKIDVSGRYPSQLGDKFGVISGSSIIIPFEYETIKYSEPFGCGIHYLQKNGKWGAHICQTGQIIPCIYNSINDLPDFNIC